MKLTVATFVQQRAEQSQQIGKVNRIVRLQGVPATDSVDNSKLFDGGVQGSISVDLNNVSTEVAAAFAGGASVTVTIDTGS